MLQISHYTKQYSAGGAKAVDNLSLHIAMYAFLHSSAAQKRWDRVGQ